jgi:hypothetical protein
MWRLSYIDLSIKSTFFAFVFLRKWRNFYLAIFEVKMWIMFKISWPRMDWGSWKLKPEF